MRVATLRGKEATMRTVHLIIITDSNFDDYACGGCGNVLYYGDEDICPFCGARIDHTKTEELSVKDLIVRSASN